MEQQQNQQDQQDNSNNQQQQLSSNQPEENKQQTQQNDDEIFDQALGDLEKDVNVTQDEKDKEDDILDPLVEKEFQSFLNSMQQMTGMNGQTSQGDNNDEMQKMTQMFQQLMGGLKDMSGMDQPENNQSNQQNQSGQQGLKEPSGNQNQQQQNPQDQQKQQEKMNNLFNQFDQNPQLDKIANSILNEFMDKEILEEPMKDAKVNYEKFLNDNIDKLSVEEKTKYVNQLQSINDILETLEKDPTNKPKLIDLFEKMQEYGPPPEPLLKAFGGDSGLFSMMPGLFGQQNKTQQNPSDGQEQCTIF